ncbi:hypothetical protein CC117_03600 [Parafrankia colletiae]|uniref:Uncharacterized protein n=1 Tax=Parafrankia colletiae TaxID=573497 RepID=A0A1S1QVS8_9ACTN|nr:hypothetical protein CC117_03600 [Parafrankia colletiae]
MSVSISPGGRLVGRGGGKRLGSGDIPAEGLLLHSLVTQVERVGAALCCRLCAWEVRGRGSARRWA